AGVDERDLRPIERGGQARGRGEPRRPGARDDDACRRANGFFARLCLHGQGGAGSAGGGHRQKAAAAGVEFGDAWRGAAGMTVHGGSFYWRNEWAHVTGLLQLIILDLTKIVLISVKCVSCCTPGRVLAVLFACVP